MQYSRHHFPDHFLLGVATSSYQIEGHKFGGAGRTHWDDFATTAGNVIRAENGAIASDHYRRYEEDVDLIENGGFDAYRFSTSWARILPEGRGQVNEQGLDFYDRLTDALLERGIKPCVTLYHWELPSSLADLGGWRNRDIASWFADFTAIIMQRIGDRCWGVAPINEPWCVSWLSHYLGHHAPGVRDIRAAARAMHHVLLAHGRAMEVMRGLGLGNLGVIVNHEWATPFDDSEESLLCAERYDGYYNRFFLDGIFRKRYPSIVLEGLLPHLPENWQDDFDIIGLPVDWCGLNYYTRKIIKPNHEPWPSHEEVTGSLPKTSMNWEIYPDGLYQFIMRATKEYTGSLPIYITENGLSSDDNITNNHIVNDEERIAYLDQHLEMVHQAILDGANVSGYFIWSLLDNYEWALGYDKRFGIVHVDFATQKRTPKQSYFAIRQTWQRKPRRENLTEKTDKLAGMVRKES